jgi:hypothetical protein
MFLGFLAIESISALVCTIELFLAILIDIL